MAAEERTEFAQEPGSCGLGLTEACGGERPESGRRFRGRPEDVPHVVDRDRIEPHRSHGSTLTARHRFGAVTPRSRRAVVTGALLLLLILVVVGTLLGVGR
jgi:hypothetical protein